MEIDPCDSTLYDTLRSSETFVQTRTLVRRALRVFALFLLYFAAGLLTLWAAAALTLDLTLPTIKHPAGISYATLILFVASRVSNHFRRFAICAVGFAAVLTWWLTLKPSNNRPWQLDVSEAPWAEVDGDKITIHNFRFCDYRAEFDFSCQWLTKTVDLSELRGVDLAISYWGSPYIAHPIVSFQFGDDSYVATSIETRKEIGEAYSALAAFFHQYELIYIFSDERDVIRLRTNYRTGEEVYLFHTTAGPQWARQLFLQFLEHANRLRNHPEWYNAVTRNCTTSIFSSMAASGRLPVGTSLYDWRILLNGRGDEMLYRGGNFAGGLPFPELKESAHINAAARQAGQSPEFSRLIRFGRPGFEFISTNTKLGSKL